MELNNLKVYNYTVCWQESKTVCWEWKHKTFALKKDAQKFAKKYKDQKPYPYIIQTVTSRDVFKQDTEVELCLVDVPLFYKKYIRY